MVRCAMEDEAREMRWDLLMLVGDGGYGGDDGGGWDVRVFISSFWGMEGKEIDRKEKVGGKRTRPQKPSSHPPSPPPSALTPRYQHRSTRDLSYFSLVRCIDWTRRSLGSVCRGCGA